MPLCLFLLHFVCIDTQLGDELAYHKLEAQLILRHLGYNLPRDWCPVTAPFALDMATFHWRLVLLVDQLRPGALLPLVGLSLWGRWPKRGERSCTFLQAGFLRPLSLVALVALVGGGSLLPAIGTPLWGWLSMQQVDLAIAAGDYQQALGWLELSRQAAPATGDSAAYQERLGQILSGLEPHSQTETVSFALARAFLQQRAYLRAYQVLFPLWLSHVRQKEPPDPWLTTALSEALAGLVEAAWPPALLSGDTPARNHRLTIAQGWLMRLVLVNPHSLYAHYLLGRVAYELHNYGGCRAEMSNVLALSSDDDLRSSAYTYIGLAEIALGHSVQGREALLIAVALDPDYRNNTAREALSGLH
uniref:Tetratricopeptide repeat protein n=1 Tax=Thermogemmatispora argillosa TaxID=2045280 RepID=A0A455T7C9_9CHLR|nr:hypothetical protein KTA_28630 [Thermogemmatispora argillosa]